MAKIQYTVKPGESLSIIARDQLGDINRWQEIAYINAIASPYTIRPGQVILLPDDSSELVVEVTKKIGAPGQKVDTEIPPAIIVLLAALGAAVLFA